MSTFIHGIAASENIDSSGEKLSILGMDISSLERDGVFNYEHKNDLPDQVIGKVLKAKKIFSEKDCEDEAQMYFWQKCLVPYLYVMGELMDDYKESAKEVAGMFKYDADRQGKQESNVANFSIEGAKIEKQGMEVTRSIARKVTITVLPCNKAAIAEMVKVPKKDDLHSLFKTESVQAEEFKAPIAMESSLAKHAKLLGIEPMIKNEKSPTSAPGQVAKPAQAPKTGEAKLPSPTRNPGKSIGTTKSNKEVFSHGLVHEQAHFNAEDHRNAALLHNDAAAHANTSKDWKLADHHNQKVKLHNQAAAGLERKANRKGNGLKTRQDKIAAREILGKALGAGSGLGAAPGGLVQGTAILTGTVTPKKPKMPKIGSMVSGAASMIKAEKKKLKGAKLAKDDADAAPPPPPPSIGDTATRGGTSTINNAIGNPFGKAEKSIWLKKAEDLYSKWESKEQFRSFMAKSMPKLTVGEIDAIGQTMVLKKSLETEKKLVSLSGMNKALKFGSPEDQKAVEAKNAELKANPPKKAEPHKKAPDINAPMDGEVSHISAYGKDHERVHLKSGHEVGGAPKGKFKSGDKVHVKPHIMGTVLIEHKK